MKSQRTYYYVQVQEGDSPPEIIHHTYKKESDEYLYKFISKEKAYKLMQVERKINPSLKYRVVKVTETHEASDFA